MSAQLDEILARGGDADDVLREVVAVLAARPDVSWAGIFFHEGDELELGPSAGSADEPRRITVPIEYRGAEVGRLAVDGEPARELLDRIATLISPYVLLGWDTGGLAWEP